ncbi:MAG: 50S ribosomal protein L25 [Acidobacteria bacterium]|nr:50S ribosomal protein L25 [Acidobacteriota bacterium]
MRKDITVAATLRPSRGKNEARRLRVSGLMPAIVYGTGKDPVAVAVNPKEVNKILHSSTGHNTIFDMAVGDAAAEPVMVVDWQHHPLKGSLLHVDLLRIDLNKAIKVNVPVHIKGEAVGVKIGGGVMEVVNREVEIECLPNDIPEFFEVDVTELGINQGVRAGDLKLAESMKLFAPAESVLVHITAPRAEEAAAVVPGAVAGAVEPEVVKAKGKKEDAAAPPAGGDKKKK